MNIYLAIPREIQHFRNPEGGLPVHKNPNVFSITALKNLTGGKQVGVGGVFSGPRGHGTRLISDKFLIIRRFEETRLLY